MDVVFSSEKLEKLFNSEKELVKVYGKQCANRIILRLTGLQAVKNLEAFRSMPGRCHELKGNRRFQLSLDLEHPLRLIFKPSEGNLQLKDDGGLDWQSVQGVEIIGVEDTHE